MTVLITIFTVLVAVGDGNTSIQWAAVAIIFIFLAVFGYAWQGCGEDYPNPVIEIRLTLLD